MHGAVSPEAVPAAIDLGEKMVARKTQGCAAQKTTKKKCSKGQRYASSVAS